ncbi:MAG: hypothetical protein LAO19_13450 [Acidobacteriia bacterium]|nr:hypothetical protein [Terriglobia bacterium]
MDSENPAPDGPRDGVPEKQTSNQFISQEANQRNTTSEFQKVEKELGSYERSTLRWTVVIVLINLITCLFLGLQWHEIKSSSSDTHTLAEQAKKQAEKMSNMSDAADKIRQAAENMVIQDQRIADNAQNALDASNGQSKATLEASIEASKLDQRAWITVEVEEKTGNFAVFMRNTGKTPAINVTEVTGFSGGTGMAPPAVDFTFNSSSSPPIPTNLPPDILKRLKQEGYIRDKPPSGYVIAPGDSQIGSDYQGKFTQMFKLGGERAYIQGKVTYDDVFGRPHETTYCFWFAPPSDFVMCNDHNKMD